MKAKFTGVLATAMLALAAFGSANASAATEVGNDCTATGGLEKTTFMQLARTTSSSLPLETPAGVVTKWRVSAAVGVPTSQQLAILRATGNPNEFLTVAESAAATVGGNGVSSFDTRIPVKAGDRLAAAPGPVTGTAVPAALYCLGTPGDSMGSFSGDPAVGSTNPYTPTPNLLAAISATVEPDADNDGFGDETQDKCPQSASTQEPCPLAVLSASAVVRKGLVTILITSNVQVPVTVAGKVNLGKGKKANLNGGTQVVVPGTLAKFTVLFPARLKEKLKSLSRKQFLQLALTATAPNIAAGPTVQKVNAKAKGQKKPARKGKKAKGKAKKG